MKSFVTPELMQWSKVEQVYSTVLKSTSIFNQTTEEGKKRFEDFHKRVIEHNIRVIAKYYRRITIKKLTGLLGLPAQVSPIEFIVGNGTVFVQFGSQ